MGFDQKGDISTLNEGPLKLVDKFKYFNGIYWKWHQYAPSEAVDCFR